MTQLEKDIATVREKYPDANCHTLPPYHVDHFIDAPSRKMFGKFERISELTLSKESAWHDAAERIRKELEGRG